MKLCVCIIECESAGLGMDVSCSMSDFQSMEWSGKVTVGHEVEGEIGQCTDLET